MCPQPTSVDAGAVIVQRSRTYTDGRKWESVWRSRGEMIWDEATGLCLTGAGVPNGSRREVRSCVHRGLRPAVDQPLT